MGNHKRLAKGFFILLIIIACIIAIYLTRRENQKKMGIEPKPFIEDLRELYIQLLDRFDRKDYSGMVDDLLGKTSKSV